jgi:hypothetical protein
MGRREHSGLTDQRKAALKRKRDARALLERENGRHARGAGYLGGYAVECKLKAIAMEIFHCWTLDELAQRLKVSEDLVYQHGLEAIAKHLPLYNRMQRSEIWRDFAGLVNQWRPSWRYNPRDWSPQAARTFLIAVDRVYAWLESNRC